MINMQQRLVRLWYVITFLSLIFMFLPFLLGVKGEEGGFAVSSLALAMVITGIVVILVYRSRAKQLDKILSGENVLAIWSYSADEWIRFVQADFEEEKKNKANLFFLVAGVSIIIAFLLILVTKDPVILVIIIGILVIVAIPAFIAPRYRFRKLQYSRAEVRITENGVLVGNMLHLWTGIGTRLEHVELDSAVEPKILAFHYSMPTRNGRRKEIIRVPVPAGKWDEALRIAGAFSSKINS